MTTDVIQTILNITHYTVLMIIYTTYTIAVTGFSPEQFQNFAGQTVTASAGPREVTVTHPPTHQQHQPSVCLHVIESEDRNHHLHTSTSNVIYICTVPLLNSTHTHTAKYTFHDKAHSVYRYSTACICNVAVILQHKRHYFSSHASP